MSSAFIKGKLKASREAIAKKEWQTAHDSSAQVLEYEPENYNAKIFLGLSLLELGEVERSEQTYRDAIKASPKQPLGWQGLSKVYERSERWDEYAEALMGLATLFAKAEDATKCAETVQRLIELRRERGTSQQLTTALSLLLPSSTLYSTLSTLPPPDATNPTATTTFITQTAMQNSLPILEEIVAIVEREETEKIAKEVDGRRKRLGAAGPEEIKREVRREVLGSSKLPEYYDEILNHPNTSDFLRRSTESKLLRHKQQLLFSLPSAITTAPNATVKPEVVEKKKALAKEVEELVEGMVLLKVPDELAWNLVIEGRDVDTIENYNFKSLREYIRLFPSSPLTNMIRGYVVYMDLPTLDPEPDEQDEDEEAVELTPIEDQSAAFDIMLEAFASLQSSILAHRVLTQVYLWDMDYQNAISVAEVGVELVRRHQNDVGKDLPLVRKAFNVVLATSLVHFFPPKHHARAIRVIEEILDLDPANVSTLMSRGYVHEYANQWEEARDVFAKVVEITSGMESQDQMHDYGLRAREEFAWCDVQLGELEKGEEGLKAVIDSIGDEAEGREEDKARCLWRLGKAHWEMGDSHRETAYTQFIQSLKCLPSYAPSFTSLGIYYSEVADPPDPNRASKCFQKAFELDAREAEAARRLAEGFADEREWDLVEVVARRVIEGEGGLEGGDVHESSTGAAEGAAKARFLPTNAWAWKAVGVVELNRQRYDPAITAFQVALRAHPEDQLSWLRLGEAYLKAGRHVAALKALNKAQSLAEPSSPDSWMITYFIGDTYRQTFQFDLAIASFLGILESRPDEPGVLMSLAQTYIGMGVEERASAFIARAESSFANAVDVGLRYLGTGERGGATGFKGLGWKIIGDALFHLSKLSTFGEENMLRTLLGEVSRLLSGVDTSGRLDGIIDLPLQIPGEEEPLKDRDVLKMACAAYHYRIALGLSNSTATGSAWFDLGISLRSLALQETAEKVEKANKQATASLMEAIKANPVDETYWIELGNMHFMKQPKTAQHAYIKALEINNKNPEIWTSLGLLYLYHDDLDLANEALYKAQTLDPDHTMAWVGQGLLASRNGHHAVSASLFEHAVSLTAGVPEADMEFAEREFARFASTSAATTSDLFPAFFVLSRYCKQRPADASALHLYALVCERLGHLLRAVELLSQTITILETAYEESEDPIIERQFMICHVNMARVKLATGDYEGAMEGYQTATGLLPDPEAEGQGEDANVKQTAVLRTQCQFGMGLASFKMDQVPEAIEFFEAALTSAGDDAKMRGHVVVMLSQVLWSLGTEEGREGAKAQLLESITEDPENLTAINALASMGILTDDDGLIDAALSEILSLPLDKRHERDPERNVDYLLVQHHLAQGDVPKALSHVQKSVFAEPSRSAARRTLAILALENEDPDAALATLSAMAAGVDAGSAEGLALRAVARALRVTEDGEEKTRDAAEAKSLAQKSVMLAPWETKHWESLAFVRSRTEGIVVC